MIQKQTKNSCNSKRFHTKGRSQIRGMNVPVFVPNMRVVCNSVDSDFKVHMITNIYSLNEN